ncbi:hypothetical protein QA584_00375 [Anaerocolumna sp. AGMB13025]|uniref:hypothetical protein n=1 Tax=Anaerocolumna sp. AGMB13025 TaxID=3039116 RepID=UPI00241FDF11|nr:hypothetical protein [Anaerocolumna sp. AGMB13025]WFR57572.1 hypothetical protein QA584_00375 [Anaerocolumna sp. AGMB13025]
MIGFRPEETKQIPGSSEQEVPPEKPGREIGIPTPFTIPSPQPDTIITSPSPEITPIPSESPATVPGQELPPIQPVEFF